MSDRSHFDGEITITPPLTWNECRITPGTDDAQVRIHEELTDGEFGQTRVLTGVAIVAKDFAYGPQLPSAIQSIIDAHPAHEFSGYIEEWVELGYRMLPRRQVVRGRHVVTVEAVWPNEQLAAAELCDSRLHPDFADDADIRCELPSGHGFHRNGDREWLP